MRLEIASLLLIVAAAAVGNCRAEDTVTALTASVASYHVNRSGDHCEVNPGVGLEHGSTWLRGLAGLYHNSNCRPSGYIGLSAAARVWGGWRAGAAVLALTGYHSEKRVNGETVRRDKTLVAPALVAVWEGTHRGVNIGFIPPARWAGVKPKDDDEEFKGLVFLQVKVLKW